MLQRNIALDEGALRQNGLGAAAAAPFEETARPRGPYCGHQLREFRRAHQRSIGDLSRVRHGVRFCWAYSSQHLSARAGLKQGQACEIRRKRLTRRPMTLAVSHGRSFSKKGTDP